MKLIYIEWIDAIHNAEWFTTTQADLWHSKSDWIVKECGWLVKEDKYGLTLANRFKVADEYTDAQVGRIIDYLEKTGLKN